MEHYKLYINGEFLNSSSNKSFQSIDPSTEQPWATIAEADKDDTIFSVVECSLSFQKESKSIFLIRFLGLREPNKS